MLPRSCAKVKQNPASEYNSLLQDLAGEEETTPRLAVEDRLGKKLFHSDCDLMRDREILCSNAM